ncbi:MAG: bifunctional methylenetetrahydrofolate dehydrogenase/methenyltetrahydrofolate cyclohydrolase FolD [Bacteroidetes bacterium]|nr:bifunctional methylenetetrahydrofolate dehydrogenase/methenyltetrahydrofolate cyclohydrolase FolD [Bacteroidota bacterium]
MLLLDGKKVSDYELSKLEIEINKIKQSGGRVPHLAAVLVGNNPASVAYVNSKIKACARIGLTSSLVSLPETISEIELTQKINELNDDASLDGYIVQLPLPKHINEQFILDKIAPEKDVDGFHPVNIGRMTLSLPCYLPATPMGIIKILEYYKIETEGKHCVVVGRSHIVGTPISILLSRNEYPGNCTVTIAHSKTTDLKSICRQADILIVALGRPEFIDDSYIKEGCVVIDVGINRVEDTSTKGYKIVGDVNFTSVKNKCSAITPVPGGVGPMTIISLLENTLRANLKQIY